jgi:hypothetical protein
MRNVMSPSSRGVAVLAVFLMVACTSGAEVQKGIDAYMRGDLNGAMEQWHECEAWTGDMNPKGRARYLVYRGLTAFEIGDTEQARRYLLKGSDAYDRGDSAWLSPNIAARMHKALSKLGP